MPCGIRSGDQVLELVSCIMPAPAHIHIGGIRHGTIKGASIMRMTNNIQGRIVSAALLAHKNKQLFLQMVIGIVRYLKNLTPGSTFVSHKKKRALLSHPAEIAGIVVLKSTPGFCLRPERPYGEQPFSRYRIAQGKGLFNFFRRE